MKWIMEIIYLLIFIYRLEAFKLGEHQQPSQAILYFFDSSGTNYFNFFEKSTISLNCGAYLCPTRPQRAVGHAIYGNCHIRLKEVWFYGRQIMGEGIMDTEGSFRLF